MLTRLNSLIKKTSELTLQNSIVVKQLQWGTIGGQTEYLTSSLFSGRSIGYGLGGCTITFRSISNHSTSVSSNRLKTRSTKDKQKGSNNTTYHNNNIKNNQNSHRYNDDGDYDHHISQSNNNRDNNNNRDIDNNKRDKDNQDDIDELKQTERLQKRLSRAGVTSRRQSEILIQEGRVTVNGKVASLKTDLLVTQFDKITVDGKPLQDSIPKIWLHNKQKKVLVSHVQDPNRDTLIPVLKKVLNKSHLMSVGRLDYYSEGLILLTNDGELSRFMELPSSGFEKQYRVRIFGKISPDMNLALTRGVTIDGMRYAPMKVTVERETDSNTWVVCTLTEGKNREIRRIFEHFNVKVLRIIRTKYGPYSLPSSLAPGETIEVGLKDEIKSFRSKWSKKEKLKRISSSSNLNNNNNQIRNEGEGEYFDDKDDDSYEK